MVKVSSKSDLPLSSPQTASKQNFEASVSVTFVPMGSVVCLNQRRELDFYLRGRRAIHHPMPDLTLMLNRVDQGEPEAAEELLALVYKQLRNLAAGKLARESAGQTLQPTALVHEAWLRLGGDQQPDWKNRIHFFASAGEAMRRILIDRARSRRAQRHGGGLMRLNVEDLELANIPDDDRVLAVNDALEKLALVQPRKAELVKLRYFAGLTIEEVAQALDISEPTAKRWWAYSRAWLLQEMGG